MAQARKRVTKKATTTRKKPAKAAPKNGRRKAAAPANGRRKAANGAKKERIPPGEMPYTHRIRGTLLYQFRALVAEHGQANAQLRTIEQELEALKMDPKFAPVWILYKKINDAKIVVKDRYREVIETQAQIATKIGLTPEELQRDWTIDTDTGVVTYTPAEKT